MDLISSARSTRRRKILINSMAPSGARVIRCGRLRIGKQHYADKGQKKYPEQGRGSLGRLNQ